MKRAKYVSALGVIILPVPDLSADPGGSLCRVFMFHQDGSWAAGTPTMTREQATAKRRDLFRLHRNLAAKRATRRARMAPE